MKKAPMKVFTHYNVFLTEVCVAITAPLLGLTESMVTRVLRLQRNTVHLFLGISQVFYSCYGYFRIKSNISDVSSFFSTL